jgi:ATPase family AAA domain-containing protein 1
MVGTYLIARHLITRLSDISDPEREKNEENRLRSTAILRRLDGPEDQLSQQNSNRPRKEDLNLSQYEQAVLQDLVFPEDIAVSFDDIGGLGHVIEELRESVIYPLTMPGLYATSSSLLSAPSGVLLYGPPGCVSNAGFQSRGIELIDRVGQNDAGKSTGTREWRLFHQLAHFDTDREMVW